MVHKLSVCNKESQHVQALRSREIYDGIGLADGSHEEGTNGIGRTIQAVRRTTGTKSSTLSSVLFVVECLDVW